MNHGPVYPCVRITALSTPSVRITALSTPFVRITILSTPSIRIAALPGGNVGAGSRHHAHPGRPGRRAACHAPLETIARLRSVVPVARRQTHLSAAVGTTDASCGAAEDPVQNVTELWCALC